MPYVPITAEVLAILDQRPLHPQTKHEIAHALERTINQGREPGLPTRGAAPGHTLAALVETGEVVRVDADHWSVTGWRDALSPGPYYLTPAVQASVARDADYREVQQIARRAEEQATQTIVDRHRAEWEEERDMIIAAVTPPDHALLWEI